MFIIKDIAKEGSRHARQYKVQKWCFPAAWTHSLGWCATGRIDKKYPVTRKNDSLESGRMQRSPNNPFTCEVQRYDFLVARNTKSRLVKVVLSLKEWEIPSKKIANTTLPWVLDLFHSMWIPMTSYTYHSSEKSIFANW